MHLPIEPSILYFGTPVILVSTLNADGSTNIAPMSSAWWLGWSCMLGLDGSSMTTENLQRTGECVLNLASEDNVAAVDKLALYTGRRSVPLHKKALGYRYCRDKFEVSGFTAMESEVVEPKRIRECPVQLEARVSGIHAFGAADRRMSVPACAIEVTIIKVHAEESLLEDGSNCRVDSQKWRPLIMNFRHFYSLSPQLQPSRLGRGPEEVYAPWKQNPMKRMATQTLLNLASRKYEVR